MEDVERIQTAHDRMRRLIDDMLRLAREGRVVDNAEPVSLTDVVEAAALTVGLTEEGTLRVEDGLPVVLADEERLSALFENLFRNAIDHAGPDPTVTVGPLDDDDASSGFYVADDGPGIPANQHIKVFESGYTTDRSGTGFGLSIVKRIANAHNWTVAVRDAADGGARFEFRGVAGDPADADADEAPAIGDDVDGGSSNRNGDDDGGGDETADR
jgi:signal transduction histidine kinase